MRKLVYSAATAQYTVTTVAGSGAVKGIDGMGTAAAFERPTVLVLYAGSSDEPVLFIGEETGCRIRRMGLRSFNVTTIAGSSIAAGACAYANGVGTASRFGVIYGLAFVTLGGFPYLVASDFDNRAIRLIDLRTLAVTTIVGPSGASAAYSDGTGAAAVVRAPTGLVIVDDSVSSVGNVTLAFSDQGFTRIRRLSLSIPPVCTTQITCDTAAASTITTETCVVCSTGRFSSAANSTACTACPIGTFCPQTGGSSATACIAGSYCNATGLSAVTACAAGVYCPANSTAAAGAGPCPAACYCAAGADRVACPSCPAGSSAPPRATITRTTATWTIGANSNSAVGTKCVTQALGVSAALAFSAMSVRVSRGVFTAAAYASSVAAGGSQQGVWLYQGCFTDSNSPRIFPVLITAAVGPDDAALSCMALARAAGYSVIGMEAWNPPPYGECWGLPPGAVSDWRTRAVKESSCGDGDALIPSGLRWGNSNFGIAIYQFSTPVAAGGQTYGIMSPGFQTASANDHFTWSVSFPTPGSASVCATAFQRGNTWTDATLKGMSYHVVIYFIATF